MKQFPSLSGVPKLAGALVLVAGALMAVATPAAAADTEKVTLWNKQDGTQGIDLGKDTVHAGKVTFVITNSSKDMEHEFLIVRTDMTFDQFPMKDSGARVDEGKLKGMEEFGDVEEGETKTWNTELKPGRYVLFCNEEGHFGAGMETVLNVTK
jgi:uncharacterized cupredoxin-like copper-binding protein